MARLVKILGLQEVITCNIITKFSNGTQTVKSIKEGDIVEGLRYIENEEVKTVTGRVAAITIKCSSVTGVNRKSPVDYFSKDVSVDTIVIDSSTEYNSVITNVPAREIVEDHGVYDVVKVDVVPVPGVTLKMIYTDDTKVVQDVAIGDTLFDMAILSGKPGTPDITGDYRVAAFKYNVYNKKLSITGLFLTPLDGGNGILALFTNIIRFTEKAHADVTSSTSLSEISAALQENDEVYAALTTDVTIPTRDDGRITTTMINAGKTLTVDLSGHGLNVDAYAFYVNGGKLIIKDTSGEGAITTRVLNNAYPTVFVANGGECVMESGLIDTTTATPGEGDVNWTYGVVCSGDGIFNMTGGKMKIQAASGISITNGTASGEGARFVIGGDAVIESVECAGVYLADNKSVVIKDNAKIIGGIVARMGDISIEDNAKVIGHTNPDIIEPIGSQVCISGVGAPEAGILALTGVYKSDLGNDLNISIADTAEVTSTLGKPVEVALINTKYDQIANADINTRADIIPEALYRIYPHDELAELATEAGKTLAPETNVTTLTVKVNGNKVYPNE